MTASRVRALSRRAGALLGAVAVLAAGCAPAAGRSGPRRPGRDRPGRRGRHRFQPQLRPPGRPDHRARQRQAQQRGQDAWAPRRRSGVSLPWAPPWCPRRAARPARVWWCRCARAAGVPVLGPAVAAALAGGQDGGRAHTWPGCAVRAGTGHPVTVLPRSRLRAGLAADHLPARPGRRGCWYPDQPEPQRVPCRNAPPAEARNACPQRPRRDNRARPALAGRRVNDGAASWRVLLEREDRGVGA